ncbi:MAG: leukotriene A4 hydrolase C-terminal domain-containing protein [Xanthomonadales bacterium]|nr:leukotriene A4 hydrolase C-terminal domain-containing protein [Xanthomonadales bacterium]
MVRFINALPTDLNERQLVGLDAALGLSTSGNAEITRSWFIQVAKRRHQPAYAAMEAYLSRYGRTRLVEPIYEALVKNGQDQPLAQSLFAQNQAQYHPVTRDAIKKVLGLSTKSIG